MASHDNNEELIDYEDEQDVITNGATAAASNGAAVAAADGDEKEKKNFSGIHSTGFRFVCLIYLLIPSLTMNTSELLINELFLYN